MVRRETEPLCSRRRFVQTYLRQRWRGEHDGRDALIVRRARVAAQQVGGHDAALHPRYGRVRETAACDGVAGRVDSGVTHALEMIVDGDAALLRTLDACHVQGQVIDLRYASRRVDSKVSGDLRHLPGAASVDDQFVAALLDRGDGRAHAYINAKITCDLDELTDQVGVESLQRPVATVENRHLRPCAGGDVRELEGDVPTPDKDDSAR